MSALHSPLTRERVALGILAGGQARRLGGADKALALFEGRTLAARTLAAVGGDFAQVLLSYNGGSGFQPRFAAEGRSHDETSQAFRVIADLRPGFPGPLGGVEAMLAVAEAEWLLTLPVDLRNIPADLFERLASACNGSDGVSSRDDEGEQPLVALWPVNASRAAVGAALDAGERAVHRVQEILGFTRCELAPLRLGNLNSPADFETGP